MQTPSAEPPWFFTHVFPWGFIIAGGAYAWDAMKLILQAHSSHGWPVVDGRVTCSRLEEWEVGEGPASLHALKLEYSYAVDGKTFQGTRVTSADSEGSSREEAMTALKRFPLGAKVSVRYCLRDPSIALLRPGVRPRQFFKLLISLVALGLGIAMLFWMPLLKFFESSNTPG